MLALRFMLDGAVSMAAKRSNADQLEAYETGAIGARATCHGMCEAE